MRIIAGKFKGRKLANCEKLKTLRPTTDKNREALFNILQSPNFYQKFENNFSSLKDCIFMDLCCGTGAVGLEAISRGAKKVIFVENNNLHLEVLKKNIELLALDSQNIEYKILSQDVLKIKDNTDNANIIFLDPPYNQDYQKIIKNLLQNNFLQKKILPQNIELNPNSKGELSVLLIIEFDEKEYKKYQSFLEENFLFLDFRKYGKSLFGFYVAK